MAVLQFHPFGTNFTLLCLQPWALFIVSFSLWCSWPSIFPIIYSFFTFSCSTLSISWYMGMVMHVRFPMNFIYRGLSFYTMKIKIITFYSHVILVFMSMIDTNEGIHEIWLHDSNPVWPMNTRFVFLRIWGSIVLWKTQVYPLRNTNHLMESFRRWMLLIIRLVTSGMEKSYTLG